MLMLWVILMLYQMLILTLLLLQGALCPELVAAQLSVLERRYSGSSVAHTAATIIQRAWREHSLRRQFQRMVTAAQSVETTGSRRLSMLEPLPLEVEVNVDSGDITLNTLEREDSTVTSPSSRHIRKGKRQMRRSTSLRDHCRSGSWSAD